MKIRYLISYPFFMDGGGGKSFQIGVTETLRAMGHDVAPLDWQNPEVDFQVLLVYGFTHQNPEILAWLKGMGVKVVMMTIFDRVHPMLLHRIKFFFGRFFGSYDLIRQRNLEASTHVIVANATEFHEIRQLFGTPEDRMLINRIGLSDGFFAAADRADPDLFYRTYGLRDFVYLPSARISRRKNQLALVEALGGTGIPVVMPGRNNMVDDLEDEILKALEKNPNVLCVDTLDQDMHYSAYRNARVSISMSRVETAGLVNLEALYLGCNLVVADTPIFREYLGDHARYVNPDDAGETRAAIMDALAAPVDPSGPAWVKASCSTREYCRKLLDFISS